MGALLLFVGWFIIGGLHYKQLVKKHTPKKIKYPLVERISR